MIGFFDARPKFLIGRDSQMRLDYSPPTKATGNVSQAKEQVSFINIPNVHPQGLVAIFLLFIIFHIMYGYTIKGANDEKIKF